MDDNMDTDTHNTQQKNIHNIAPSANRINIETHKQNSVELVCDRCVTFICVDVRVRGKR